MAWAVIAVLWPSEAHAVPSFARQTGLECMACHVSWPELTSVGRQFKLGAYTLTQPPKGEERPLVSFDKNGPPPVVPLAAFLQASMTHTARTKTGGTDSSTFPKQDALILQQASLLAGFALLALTGQPREAAAAKAQKEDVAYRDKPNGGKSCASCRQFSPSAAGKGTCAIVEGEVSASGWCVAYSASGTATSQDPSVNAAITQARTNRVRNAAVPSTAHTEEGVHT